MPGSANEPCLRPRFLSNRRAGYGSHAYLNDAIVSGPWSRRACDRAPTEVTDAHSPCGIQGDGARCPIANTGRRATRGPRYRSMHSGVARYRARRIARGVAGSSIRSKEEVAGVALRHRVLVCDGIACWTVDSPGRRRCTIPWTCEDVMHCDDRLPS